MLELIEPFPESDYGLLFKWMHEFPDRNLDDSGPKAPSDMPDYVALKYRVGHRVIEVLKDGNPVGAIGYEQAAFDVGMFRGICFTEGVHGSGIPIEAVAEFLSSLFMGHTQKILAQHFSDNPRVSAFLKKLGAVHVESGISPTPRNGQPVSIETVVITNESFLQSVPGRRLSQEHLHSSGAL